MDMYTGSTRCCGTDGSEEEMWNKDKDREKEIWISLRDLLDGLNRRTVPSWVTSERLIIQSDLMKIVRDCRKMEA